MRSRIVLAIACAAALLIGLTVWLRVDMGARPATDLVTDSESTPTKIADDALSPSPSADVAVDARAPVASKAPVIDAARNSDLRPEPWAPPGIFGSVSSTKNGAPVVFATVNARVLSTSTSGVLPIDSRTSAEGLFQIATPVAGRWHLTCSARGFQTVERDVEVEAVQRTTRSDFVLTPVTETPKLLVCLRSPNGRPLMSGLEGPDLDVAKVLRPVILAECPQRNADLPPGTSILPIRATAVIRPQSDEWYEIAMEERESACCCLMLGQRVLDAVPFDASTATVSLVASRGDLQRSLGSMSVMVVDDVSGQALTAVVELHPENGATRNMTTDATGSARVDHLLQGDVVVRVFASLHAPITRKAVVRAGETVDLGVIRMVKTVEITGWIEGPAVSVPGFKIVHTIDGDSAGTEPVQATSVFAYRIDPDQPLPPDPSATASADASGAFQLADLPPGEYLLTTVRNRPPNIKVVQEHKVLGWLYVDARFASATGVRVP